MLGTYDNFPTNIHKTTTFSTLISTKKLQQTLTETLNKTNNEKFTLEQITNPSQPQCTAIFEYGIAESNNFNYLDNEETKKVLTIIRKKPFQTMDFYCSIRYYKEKEGKTMPLKFDYYMIRFIFNKNLMETRVFHERGNRYVSPEDVTEFIVKKISSEFSRKALKEI